MKLVNTGLAVTNETNSIIQGNFENQTKIFLWIHSKNALKTVLARSGAEKNSFLVLTDVVYMMDVMYMAVITSFDKDRRRFSKLPSFERNFQKCPKFLIIFDYFRHFWKYQKYQNNETVSIHSLLIEISQFLTIESLTEIQRYFQNFWTSIFAKVLGF